MRAWFGLMLLTMTACGSAPPTAESCASICAGARTQAPAEETDKSEEPNRTSAMSDFEAGLLNPILEDIRAGVRPFHDEGIGLCKGKESCDGYLGMTADLAEPGDYILQAELRVPRTGERGTWKVRVDFECTYVRTTEAGENSSTQNSTREYEVAYAGEKRGYRLVPLRKIKSPHDRSSESCSWKIIAPHPDGDKVYEGSWTAPAAPE